MDQLDAITLLFLQKTWNAETAAPMDFVRKFQQTKQLISDAISESRATQLADNIVTGNPIL